MVTALLDMTGSGRRNKAWAENMVNLEARKLVSTANTLSAFHLKDSLSRINFVRYLPADYYRKVNTMSKPKLTMKIAGYGVKAKVIFDLLSTENN